MSAEEVGQAYEQICADPVGMVGFMALVVVWVSLSVPLASKKGLERDQVYDDCCWSLWWCSLSTALPWRVPKKVFPFYLKPDLEKMKEVGVGNVILGAMTQAFFTLSMAWAAWLFFGSYIGKERF